VKDSSKRGRHGAQSRQKFGEEQRTGALLGENTFGAPHAGIRLKRNFAKELQDFDASSAAKLIPEHIRGQGGEHGAKERSEETHSARARKRAGSQQQRHGRNREPHLLCENPGEKDYISMMQKEFECAVH
jgi:hypothetical protein